MPAPLIPVKLRVALSYGDRPHDANRDPDFIYADRGTATLTPLASRFRFYDDDGNAVVVSSSAKEGVFKTGGRAQWAHDDPSDSPWNILIPDMTSDWVRPRFTEPGEPTHTLTLSNVYAENIPAAYNVVDMLVRIAPDQTDADGEVDLGEQIPSSWRRAAPVEIGPRGLRGYTGDKGDKGDQGIPGELNPESVAAVDSALAARDEAVTSADTADTAATTAGDRADDAATSANTAGTHADTAEGHADAADAARNAAEGSATTAGQHAEAVEGWHAETQAYRQAIRDAAQYMDTGWIDFVLTSSVYGPISWGEPPQWRVVNGVVYWRGIIERSSGNFQQGHEPINLNDQAAPLRDLLPDGSRHWVVAGQSNAVIRVYLNIDGLFGVHAPPTGGYTTPSWISLEGISWPVSDDAAGMVPAELLLARDEASAAVTAAESAAGIAEGYRDEAQDAALAAQGLTGTGSPEGTVAAPVGTAYRDVAGTMGAWSWLKTSGTGRSGWTVVYGDTGWRDIAADIIAANGYTGQGRLQIRRTNGMAFVYGFDIRLASPPPTGSAQLFTVPSGFRTGIAAYSRAYDNSRLWTTGTNFSMNNPAQGDRWLFGYPVSDGWPTSLPGTPA